MLKQDFFYPLYKKFEKKHFIKLLKAVENKYEFVGLDKDKIFLTKSVLYYQLIVKDYRQLLQIIDKQLAPKISITTINEQIKKTKFIRDLSWVNWLSEKEMIQLVERLWHRQDFEIIGNNKQFDEFMLRYLISVWLVAWTGPCFAVLKTIEKGVFNLKEVNNILSLWDFSEIFSNY